MANIQIKGINDDLYAELKVPASSENRSISQQILFLLKGYLVKNRNSTAHLPRFCWNFPAHERMQNHRSRLFVC